MKIELLPRIIDDNGNEVREGDVVTVRTKTMDEPALALVSRIDTLTVTMVFVDMIFGNSPQTVRASQIRTLVKSK